MFASFVYYSIYLKTLFEIVFARALSACSIWGKFNFDEDLLSFMKDKQMFDILKNIENFTQSQATN